MQLLGVDERLGPYDFYVVEEYDDKYPSNYTYLAKVSHSPFLDCQSFSIGGFHEAFSSLSVNKALSLLLSLKTYVGKYIMVFNVNTEQEDNGILYEIINRIKANSEISHLCPTLESIDYISTNGSKMRLNLFNMKKMCDYSMLLAKEFNIKLLKYQRLRSNETVVTYGEEKSITG